MAEASQIISQTNNSLYCLHLLPFSFLLKIRIYVFTTEYHAKMDEIYSGCLLSLQVFFGLKMQIHNAALIRNIATYVTCWCFAVSPSHPVIESRGVFEWGGGTILVAWASAHSDNLLTLRVLNFYKHSHQMEKPVPGDVTTNYVNDR